MGFFDKVKTAFESGKNFKYLDDLIHSGAKKIVLDSDIVLGDGEESEYKDGIRLDVYDLAIDGNGHTINAQGLTRIFKCTGNVTIKNITLKNGFAEDNGGAIHNSGNLTITDSTFTENSADFGGAIHNSGELTITDSTFTGNTVSRFGGAIENISDLTITESTLSGNTAKEFGGAIVNGKGDLTITGSMLTGNTSRFGGAIYAAAKLTIRDSTLNNNTAERSGGAIGLHVSKKYESENCTFRDNEPDDVHEDE